MPIVKESIDAYWGPTNETLYDAYYHELRCEALVKRWQRIDLPIAILVAATASGSALTGLAFWSEPSGKYVWAMISGTASVASIVHVIMKVPDKVKEQENFRRLFSELRTDLETLRQDLKIGLDINQAKDKFDRMRGRLSQYTSQMSSDLLSTRRLEANVQSWVNKVFNEKKYSRES